MKAARRILGWYATARESKTPTASSTWSAKWSKKKAGKKKTEISKVSARAYFLYQARGYGLLRIFTSCYACHNANLTPKPWTLNPKPSALTSCYACHNSEAERRIGFLFTRRRLVFLHALHCFIQPLLCMCACMYIYVCMHVCMYISMWYVLIRPPIPYITSSRCKRLHKFRPKKFLLHKRTNPRPPHVTTLVIYLF